MDVAGGSDAGVVPDEEGSGIAEGEGSGEAAYNQAWAEEHGLQLIGGNNRAVRLLQARRR